jgi:hypothetical protein
MTDDRPIAATSYCVVIGCSDPDTRPRLIVTGPETELEVEVCAMHSETDLDINDLELGEWGE